MNQTIAKLSAMIEEVRLFGEANGVLAILQPTPGKFDFELELTDLYATPTGMGNGTKVMQFMIAKADQYSLTIYISPAEHRNKVFYARFGFGSDKFRKYWGAPLVRYPANPMEEEE